MTALDPVGEAASLPRRAPHGVMFHHFHDRTHLRGQGAISAQQFHDLLVHVGLDTILPARDWMRRALAGELADTDVCLTFDDALRCQYDVALPVLSDLRLTAFWFVYSSVFEGNVELLEVYRHFRTACFADVDSFYARFFTMAAGLYPREYRRGVDGFDPASHLVEFRFYTANDRLFRYVRDDVLGAWRYQRVMQAMMDEADFDIHSARRLLWMDDDHLRHLHATGNVIGLHSYSHPTRLGELPLPEQEREYQRNFGHLARVMGEAPTAVSHPCNSYGPGTLEILRRMGIRLGFRANMAAAPNRSALEYRREDHTNLVQEMPR